ITVFGTVPLVFVRSRVTVALDPSTGRVGLNPGASQDGNFFSQFDTALATLSTRIQRGDFAADPATLALAQQTLSGGAAMRAGLFTLLADLARASPVLPTSSDPYGRRLLTTVSSLQNTLSTQLGITTFTASPALPATALTNDQFVALISAPGGFGLTSTEALPQLVLGDLEAGVAVQLEGRGAVGGPSWRTAWVRLTGRFPTGTAADPAILLGQGSGDKNAAMQVDAIIELGRRRIGIRGEATYQHQLPLNSYRRISTPDQVLVPPSLLAAIRSQPGDSFAIAMRPFVAFAPHLALTALAQYWRRGTSRSAYLTGQLPIAGTDPSQLDVGSAATAFVVGVGLSYSYTGAGRDGSIGLPVEAGWSLERTVASGQGIFPAPLTSRVSLRIYRPIVKH
ncbi:MAG: hypothetical protein ACRELE_10880, partial [Gemmatimonadales bacterium]